MGKVVAGALVTAGIVVTIILFSILNGWVLSILWGWFLVPLGVPAISIPLAIGIGIIANMLTNHYAQQKEDYWITALIHPFVALSVGFIVHLFV